MILVCLHKTINTVKGDPQMPPSQRRDGAQQRGWDIAFPSRNRRRSDNNDSNSSERRFKCGLTNHKTFECRHKKASAVFQFQILWPQRISLLELGKGQCASSYLNAQSETSFLLKKIHLLGGYM